MQKCEGINLIDGHGQNHSQALPLAASLIDTLKLLNEIFSFCIFSF
jgi:hypothetical protein